MAKLVNCHIEDDVPDLVDDSDDERTYELETVDPAAYKAAMDALVCPDWFDHPPYLSRNGRRQQANKVLSVEVFLASKIAHQGVVNVVASLKNNTSSFWQEVTTHLAMAWMRNSSLEQTSRVVKQVQSERKCRKARIHWAETDVLNMDLTELLMNILATPKECDPMSSDNSTPPLGDRACHGLAKDIPVPADEEPEDCNMDESYAAPLFFS